jgi:hypothetical protein
LAASGRSPGAFTGLSAVALIEQWLAAASAAQATAQADRMRTLLLATVSHDLRTPLAAAKVAVSGLRSRDIPLTADDHDELLATAEESLDLLTRLTTSLLDASRLQAGVLPVFPRPVDLAEIITRSLGSLGPPAQAVKANLPPGLPQVIADPPIMERVIANLTSNALRYSPAGSPPLLTAGVRGERIELRVVDRGPGVPPVDRERTPVLPSGWTPLGLVKHLGFAERHWFQRVAAGSASELPWAGLPGEEEGRGPFTTGLPADVVFGFYQDQCERANATVAATPLSAPPQGRHPGDPAGEICDLRRLASPLVVPGPCAVRLARPAPRSP